MSQAGLFHSAPEKLWYFKTVNFNQVFTINFNLSKFQNISGNQIEGIRSFGPGAGGRVQLNACHFI